jgi:hypothetical protein
MKSTHRGTRSLTPWWLYGAASWTRWTGWSSGLRPPVEMAHHHLRLESEGHTLSTTAVVHERTCGWWIRRESMGRPESLLRRRRAGVRRVLSTMPGVTARHAAAVRHAHGVSRSVRGRSGEPAPDDRADCSSRSTKRAGSPCSTRQAAVVELRFFGGMTAAGPHVLSHHAHRRARLGEGAGLVGEELR